MTNLRPPPAVVLNDNENLPSGSRSPHPYAHTRLDEPSHGYESSYFSKRTETSNGPFKTSSESGTEADDESGTFFRGLPAPPTRPRKGLRGAGGKDEALSPLVTPRMLRDEKRSLSLDGQRDQQDSRDSLDQEEKVLREKYVRRRRGEVVRRVVEIILLMAVAMLVCLEHQGWRTLKNWQHEIMCHIFLTVAIYVLILFQHQNLSNIMLSPSSFLSAATFRYPSSFDPAPFLYPVFLPLLLSISQAEDQMSLVLPNSILGLCSLFHAATHPGHFKPTVETGKWFVAILPLLVSANPLETVPSTRPLGLKFGQDVTVDAEDLILLPLLHASLVETLHFLTATSLDSAELQLLSTALVDLLMFSTSPQMEILKGIVWIGGITLFVSCSDVLGWELALARVPTWRFRRLTRRSSARTSKSSLIYRMVQPLLGEMETSSESEDVQQSIRSRRQGRQAKVSRESLKGSTYNTFDSPINHFEPLSRCSSLGVEASHGDIAMTHRRRHTLSNADGLQLSEPMKRKTTPGGRLKRSVNPSSRSFLSLTATEAYSRRMIYATYIYAVAICIVLVPVRMYIAGNALAGQDPFGWAIGYLFGQIKDFRLWVVKANLENWILLPRRPSENDKGFGQSSWINSFRLQTIGAANTRLLVIGYWIVLLSMGIGLVLRLSAHVEVDTRRKVFHGLIVAMVLPVSFIDPCFTALALVLALSVFLLLDLLRASQVPPIARPLTTFLAPYVDGRDHRGPVIVSHIFLLIGCAIPFWLSLSGIEKAGSSPWQGWESLAQDISMVTGVICVGMGDAAASLFGRRYGRHKWVWGGGKSIEGSLAFVLAVSVGLLSSKLWLRLGGWDRSQHRLTDVSKTLLAATGASLTEAVLTGANDNVVVPLILWLLVRGLRI